MKVENHRFNNALNPVQQPPRVDTSDANKMNRLMGDKPSDKSISLPQKNTDNVTQAKARTTTIREWYETLKRSGNFSAAALSSTLKDAFISPSEKKVALWYAFSQEKSAKDTEKASPELFALLERELLGSFSGRLLAAPPKDNQELKALLSEQFPLGAQKEQVLWHCWAELKDIPDKAPVLDLVRKELSFVIQKNAMVKNMLTYSHKLDLS
ncbi:type III secretion effector, YopR family [Vibrio splendidus]|uniref:Type III secretion effector protein (YopR, encoded by YscH) n=3 Tax=Vibrio TaxID=662 RepID=A0A0H4A337_9VIBR|nr:YopR family T3SS polymerization control protein [Vibrio splendidus]AKN39527.1 Type III secretion effector protein (YopR, encoded by YscH) [Vibrio splendidus]AKN40226.1 Type III secretion effector protein (YopR, encoded by YscH) [Vibrio tasmaniensis]PMM76035.1 type III secretion effector, YopR family [Vibrio splendidus]